MRVALVTPLGDADDTGTSAGAGPDGADGPAAPAGRSATGSDAAGKRAARGSYAPAASSFGPRLSAAGGRAGNGSNGDQ
jgi:hypothetical protein